MAKLNKIQFLFFVSSMIFPAYALDVIFASALENFKQKAEIDIDIMNGTKMYVGTLNELIYEAQPTTTRVIVYIIDGSRFVEIIRNAVRETRLQIALELFQWRCELVFLGIENFRDDEYDLISGLIVDKILSHPDQRIFTIETIGENRFDHFYHYELLGDVLNLGKYQENAHICGGILRARLRSIPRGALKPAERNNKEIKLYGYHPNTAEMTWPVSVINGTYFPESSMYNFGRMHQNKKIYLLILSGKDYSLITSYRGRWLRKKDMKERLRKMTKNDEVLFIMGVFNFDWTEIDIVTQIILKHSEGSQSSDYNVFSHGYGMFNTYYLNVYDDSERYILKQSNSNVSDIIKAMMGGEVNERAINMYFYENGWQDQKIPISLYNGRYLPATGFNFTFPWLNQKIAFIVYDSTERNDQIDLPMVYQSVEELDRSGIRVIVIEAINFVLDDVHIVAQWIEYHKDIINPEQIAVLGGGIFDTIFQSYATTYKTFFNTKKNEMKTIRNFFVKNGNEKRISIANIDTSKFEVWSYPMNTIVNGFYEPDLMPDKNMFDNANKRYFFFILTSAYNFQQISKIEDAGSVTSLFRGKIHDAYPIMRWSVFLVGLDNFRERDSHLFAELVNVQTYGDSPLSRFVRILSYGVDDASYQYRDNEAIPNDWQVRIPRHFKNSFGMACKLLDDTDD